MDFKYFPYDNQICKLKFGSWHHSVDTVNLTHAGTDTYSYQPHGDFKATNTTWKKNVVKYDCCEEEYADIEFDLHLTRVSSAYGAKLVLPAVLTGFMILTTFLLPPASFEKTTLCGLIFVSLLLQLMYLHDIVPASGDTILGEYLAFALFLDFFATVIAAASYQIHVRSPDNQKEHSSSEGGDGDLKNKVPQDVSWLMNLLRQKRQVQLQLSVDSRSQAPAYRI